MPMYLAISPDGVVDGMLTMDERAAAVHPMKPGYRLMKTPPATCDAVRMMGRAAVVRDGRIAIMPEAAATKWEATRGVGFGTITEDRGRRRGCRGEAWWRRAVERAGIQEIADDDPAWSGPAAPKLPRARSRVPFVDVELKPGLWVRQITSEAEMDVFAQRVLAYRFFDEGDEDTRARIDGWLYGPSALPLRMEWRGRALQYEVYHVNVEEGPQVCRAGFNIHVDDERPFWLWALLAQPAFQALYAAGYRTIRANSVITNPPSYIAALIEFYGARELGRSPDGRWAALEYDLEALVTAPPTWPNRPTAGPGWTGPAGAATLREAADADLPLMHQAITAAWSEEQAAPIHRQLDEWWELDRAAVLIGEQEGAVRYLRAARPRRTPGVAIISVMLPATIGTPQEQRAVSVAFFGWLKLAGFARASMFVPLAQWSHPRAQSLLTAAGHHEIARHQRARGEIVETEVEL